MMAKFSMKQGGKEVGNADVYAEPHTMTGKPVNVSSSLNQGGFRPDPNTLSSKQIGEQTPVMRVSIGDRTKEPKTTGIKIRGTGAATKGVMARGPMG
jgi:hypothetical protein